MNIFFRTILAFYAFCLTLLSLVLMLFTIKPEYLKGITNYLVTDVLPNRNASIFLFFIELVFFALSIVFLLSGVKSDKESKAIKRFTNYGEIRISLASIESIVLAATRKLTGVKETKAYVKRQQDGVMIQVKIIVYQDTNIPMLSEDIQVRVKKVVEETTGVKVFEVSTSVENVSISHRGRVE